jgi:hypothetical protein
MPSKRARDLKRPLIAETQRLTPEERVQAFLTHSRLLAQLHLAGQKLRDSKAPRPS